MRGFGTVIGTSVVLVGGVDVVDSAGGTGSLLVGWAGTVTVTVRSLGRSLVVEGWVVVRFVVGCVLVLVGSSGVGSGVGSTGGSGSGSGSGVGVGIGWPFRRRRSG